MARKMNCGAVSINDAGLTAIVHQAQKSSRGVSGVGSASRMGPISIKRFVRPKGFLHKTNADPDPWWPREGPALSDRSTFTATALLAEMLCGDFDNKAQVEKEKADGSQTHPHAKHVTRVVNQRIQNLPQKYAKGLWLLEESYYTAPGATEVTVKPLLLYFEADGNTAVLHSYKWPAEAVTNEAFTNDNPDWSLDFETLTPSPGFPPTPYTREGESFSLKVSIDIGGGKQFTLSETLCPTGLSVLEQITQGETSITPYTTPIEYRRMAVQDAAAVQPLDPHGGCESLEAQPQSLFRRTTLLVADIERSLQLYRDALGLSVVYDNVVPIGGKGLPVGVFDTRARLVFLKSFDDEKVGVIGLLCFTEKPLQALEEPRRQLGLGDTVLLLNTIGVTGRMERVKAIEGVFVQSEASVATYPTAGGGTCTVLGNSFFDPDGHFVELNEVTW